MAITTTPHNDFFYQVMSRKDKALAFFERYLPVSIREQAELSQLELCESKHLSEEGVSLYNDVLYRCPLAKGQVGYLFAMCEHQSSPHAQMPLRLLQYDTATIVDHLKQGHKQFPVVVNIVVYHGKKPWNYSTAFADYYANPALGAQNLYMAPFTLINLPELAAEEVYQDRALGFCLAAFQCTSSSDPYQAFARSLQAPIFREHFASLPAADRHLVLSYLGSCIDRDRYSLEQLVNLVTVQAKEKEALMRSIAQGYQEVAWQEGRQEEKLGIAKGMLQDKLPKEQISKWTGLDLHQIEQLSFN